jgi:predicted RNA-binding protein with PIN domain
MPYIIDGHNLIPKISGLSLGSMDDEDQLVDLLQDFCRVRRQKVEVYFDNASPGQSGARNIGIVRVQFVPAGSTADDAILRRLNRLGRSAKNWTVVSSDRAVGNAAKAVHARTSTSEEFAKLILSTLGHSGGSSQDEDVALTPEEVEDWLKFFGADNSDN